MIARALLLVIAGAFGPFGPSTVPAQAGNQVTAIQLPDGTEVEAAFHEDVDGDGRRDLCIATSQNGRDYARTLRIHYATGTTPAFRQQPDLIAPVPPSVSACAIGDVHVDPGNEIIWFGALGAYVWRPRAKDAEREAKLVAGEFLYQYPDPLRVLSWQQGVVDINGDGLPDLLLPEPNGYRIAVQSRQADAVRFATAVLELPATAPDQRLRRPAGRPEVQTRRRGNRFEIGTSLLSVDARPRPPLVAVAESVPAPQLHDWDGDGDLDVIAKLGERVFVWLQPDGGTFAAAPSITLQFPLTGEQTRFDPRFSASLVDFNRDRLVDAVLVAKDGNPDQLRTQIMFFPQRPGPRKPGTAPLFAKGLPEQLLILAGFTSPPSFTDIDGDGSIDLSIASWRIDVLDQITSRDHKLDVEIYVYLNDRGKFSRRPDLTHRATLDGAMLQRGGDKLFARFVGDVTGDGVSDLLVRDRPERLRLLMLRKVRGALSLLPKPVWELSVSAEARLVQFSGANAARGFLVTERNQVLVVNF